MNPIREAAKRLPGAWYQGEMSSPDGTKCCGLGHVGNVLGSSYSNEFLDAWSIMDKVAEEQYPDRVFNSDLAMFPAFNDHPDTTEDEVVAVMEKAAVRWDEQIQG